jgi:hypothetical protein
MRRSFLTLFSAAVVLATGLFVATPAATSNTGPFDFNLDVIGTGVAGSTMNFVITGADSEVHYVIMASPNLDGQVIDPFNSPAGDAPPFSLCIGKPTLSVVGGNTDLGGSALAARRVPPVIRPQAAARTYYFQAFFVSRNGGRQLRGFVSDVESAYIAN